MKKATKRPYKISKTPPPGWPTEDQWKEIDKKLEKKPASKALPSDAGPVERTKHELCAQFIKYRRQEDINQRELAQRLGVTDSRVSEILHYHHGRFTIDKLLELLAKIRPEVKIRVA
ncbi:XRE family transcriptional regulator [Bdellovibrio sp. HCB290]|uniref:XRE family transcriptional regulator n=1 Tax=Bdellovibrio sp. HCB290 TaxID=3394356 RepID=UPI0039B67261